MGSTDTYKTVTRPSPEVLFKEKNSKFYGYVIPVTDEAGIKHHLEILKKQHHAARHWCYAYQIGMEVIRFRANDDGEPNNSAGQPIYGQIQSYGITNVLIVVVRYFGGIKLGVGGLITAYKTTAQMALEASNIEEKTINKTFRLTFDYKNMDKVMRIIKRKRLKILNQELTSHCEIQISVRKNAAEEIFGLFKGLYEINVISLND